MEGIPDDNTLPPMRAFPAKLAGNAHRGLTSQARITRADATIAQGVDRSFSHETNSFSHETK